MANTRNTWEQFYARLQEDALTNSDTAKVRDRLLDLAAGTDINAFRRHATELFRDRASGYGLSASNTDIANAVNELEPFRQAYVDQIRERQAPQQEQPPQQPQEPGAFAGLAKGLGERKTAPSVGGGKTGDMATPAVHSIQEEELLKQFNDAIEQGDQDKIKELLGEEASNKAGAVNIDRLLQEQTNLAHTHLDLLTPEELKLSRLDGIATDVNGKPLRGKDGRLLTKIEQKHIEFDNQARKQAEARKKQEEKVLTPAERDAKEKARAKEVELEARVKDATVDKDRRKAAAYELVQRRLTQTRPYSIFTEYYEQDLDGVLVSLSQLMANQALVRQRMAQRQNRMQALHQQAAQQEAQEQNQGGNGVTGALKSQAGKEAKKGLRKIAGQVFKRALEEAGKAAVGVLSQPEVLIPIIIGVLIVFIIAAIVAFIIIVVTQQNQNTNIAAIPGLTLTLTTNPPGQTHYANGQNIAFTIDAVYTGQYSIILVDKTPNNATVIPNSVTGTANLSSSGVTWILDANPPLPDSTPSQKHWRFSLTFANVGKDAIFHNSVVAQYALGSGPQNLAQNLETRGLNSVPNNQAGGSCAAANLARYFGSASAGKIASCICKYESGGDPGVVNKACLSGKSSDWSVGLFQINLDTNPQRCGGAFQSTGPTCTFSTNPKISKQQQATLNNCTANLKDPVANINAAVRIYQAGHGWDSGWNAEKGKCF